MPDKGIFDLTGKTALITGASRGIGRYFAEALAEYGADIACVARTESKLKETIGIIEKYGHKAVAIPADVSDEKDIKRMVDETVSKLGKIDILINNAGMSTPMAPIHEMKIEDWDTCMNINLRGLFITMKYVISDMLKRKSGSIINISSIAGLRAEVPEMGPASYGASKAAIINLTQVAAIEYAASGIRVNCIAPGFHQPGLGTSNMENVTPEMKKAIEDFANKYCEEEIPMKRSGHSKELSGLIILLASNASSYITGQVFVQDGGQSARI